MLTTKNSGALVSGPARRNPKAESMSEKSIRLNDGRVTSKGPFGAGDIVSLPEPEANLFIRKKWGKAEQPERRQPVVFDEPQVEDREADQAAGTSKRKK